MSRIAVVSDIHGNLHALQAVLADADAHHADALWCLGDTVGYGPRPNECVALMRERAKACLAGNHDLGAIGRLSLDDFNAYAAEANRWTAGVLTAQERDFLSGLPAKRIADGVTLVHGSPREPVWEYVVSEEVALASFRYFDTALCLVGHSHIPFYCMERLPGEHTYLVRLTEDEPVPLQGRRAIVNPGSVGQPRDGDSRASYALLDTDAEQVTLRRVAYDIAATQREMGDAGLPSRLIERLSHGH